MEEDEGINGRRNSDEAGENKFRKKDVAILTVDLMDEQQTRDFKTSSESFRSDAARDGIDNQNGPPAGARQARRAAAAPAPSGNFLGHGYVHVEIRSAKVGRRVRTFGETH